MILLDSLLLGGLRFVLDRLAAAVDAELNDAERLREELLSAGMRLELGEISEEEFAALERDLLARLRGAGERRLAAPGEGETLTVAGIEVRLTHDERS